MSDDIIFHICPICFKVCETEMECHAHMTVECNAGKAGSDFRKPLTDQYGHLVSRAPRWYLEAMKRIPAWTPLKRRLFNLEEK
jgi:hypothetical protein